MESDHFVANPLSYKREYSRKNGGHIVAKDTGKGQLFGREERPVCSRESFESSISGANSVSYIHQWMKASFRKMVYTVAKVTGERQQGWGTRVPVLRK